MIGHFPIYPATIEYLKTTFTNPVGIAYDLAGNRLAIVEFGSKVTFINATTYAIVHTTLASSLSASIASIGFDSVNNRFFVGDDDINGKVHIISGADYSITLNAISVSGTPVYRGFVFDYSTDRIFISCYGQPVAQPISKISVHKISDLSFVTSFSADKASGIEIDITTRKLYVAGHTSANVKVYDIDTFTLLNTITGTGDLALSLAYGITQDPINSDYMIVQDFNLNKMLLLRKSTNSFIKVMKGITSARMSVFVGNKIHVTQANINKVSEYILFY